MVNQLDAVKLVKISVKPEKKNKLTAGPALLACMCWIDLVLFNDLHVNYLKAPVVVRPRVLNLVSFFQMRKPRLLSVGKIRPKNLVIMIFYRDQLVQYHGKQI